MTFSVPGPKLSGISVALRVVYISSAGPEEHKHGVFKKTRTGGGPAAKDDCCYCGGLSSQHSHGDAQRSVTQVPENSTPSSGLFGKCIHVVHLTHWQAKHVCTQNKSQHILKEGRKSEPQRHPLLLLMSQANPSLLHLTTKPCHRTNENFTLPH